MASSSLLDDHHIEDEVVEDEIWENQRREGGMWLPAWDRGRFSDRFGRYKYNQVFDVPMPPNSRIVEDFFVESVWMYAKNFGTLEGDLAKGVHRSERWNYAVRWRRWVRKRYSMRETSNEGMAGWLGSKERRGTWKSRYFILLGGNAAAAAASLFSGTSSATPCTPSGNLNGANGTGGEDSEDESSNDEGDLDDVEDEMVQPVKSTGGNYLPPPQREAETEDPSILVGSPISSPITASLTRRLSNEDPSTIMGINPACHHPPLLIYLRRSFSHPKAAFPLTFDINELRSFPKKQVRTLKLSGRVRVDDSLATTEFPGRFAIRFTNGRKRVLNAASGELRERWVDALRTLIEESGGDVTTSPTAASRKSGRLYAAYRAAKRGQQELRKGLGTLRRSSVGNSSHQSMVVSSSQVPSPSLGLGNTNTRAYPALSLDQQSIPMLDSKASSHIMELLRAESNGAIGIRFIEPVAGKGLFVEAVLESAKDAATGLFPAVDVVNVGDNVVAIQSESLLGHDKGMALNKLKEVLSRTPRPDRVSLSIIPSSRSSKLATTPKAKGMSSPALASSSSSSTSGMLFGGIDAIAASSAQPLAVPRREHHSPAQQPQVPSHHHRLIGAFGLENNDDSEDDVAGATSKASSKLNGNGNVPSPTRSTSWAFKPHSASSVSLNSASSYTPPQLLMAMSSSSSSTGGGVNSSSSHIHPIPRPPVGRSVSAPAPLSARPKMVEVPPNGFGIVSSHARSVTIQCLDRMTQARPQQVTYAQLRHEVATVLHVEPLAFETDEWRLWFRDLLDYWICDGNKYSVGGLDLVDFTPVILRNGAIATAAGATTTEAAATTITNSSSAAAVPSINHVSERSIAETAERASDTRHDD